MVCIVRKDNHTGGFGHAASRFRKNNGFFGVLRIRSRRRSGRMDELSGLSRIELALVEIIVELRV